MRRFQKLYLRFVGSREEYIGNRGFTVLLAIQVGLIAALAALFLKKLIHFIEKDGIELLPPYFFFFFPMIGIAIVVLLYTRVFISASGFHGIAGVLESIRRKSSIIHYTLMYAQMITAAITIGLGGSSGLESPTVVTGSAIGSNSARFFRLNYKYRTLFIGCGTAGTIAAIFNAPIAGVIFATEVILPQFSATIFIPILISSATGAFFSALFVGDSVLFRVEGVVPFTLQEIPLILVLGVFAGLVSLYYTKIFALCKILLSRIANKWRKAIAGGLILGTLIFLFPVLFGEGYVGITQIISGDFHKIWQQSVFGAFGENTYNILLVFGLLILIKPLAASVTVHSGGEGGQFAPSFVTGGFTGFFFYLVASTFLPNGEIIHPTNYILLGMAAVLSGVMHAPLTGIFLVAEVTESYDLFIGLMLASAIAFFTKIYFDRVPIHFKGSKTARDIESSKHEFISINNIAVAQLVDRKITAVDENSSCTELISLFANEKTKIIAVRNADSQLTGIITEHQLSKLLNRVEKLAEIPCKEIMVQPVTTVQLKEQMDLVVHKFDTYNVDFLPVFARDKHIGFISRISVLSSFREALKNTSDFLG